MSKEIIKIEKGMNVIELTYAQLKETRTFADAYGVMPKQFPVEHHVFIDKLLDFAKEANVKASVGQILASVKHIEKISESEAESKGLDQDLAENTSVRVLIGRIDLGDTEQQKLWNLAIGFMYHEKGIEVSIGTNISICANMTIFGETTHYKNHGRNGIEMSDMFKEIQNWFSNLEHFDTANSELLQRMAAIDINWFITGNEFIGDCLRRAVRKNYHKGEPFALNVSQVSKMASYMIEQEDKINSGEFGNGTLYHLYNAGTYILTHYSDLQGKFGNIKGFTEWFEKEWLIPTEQMNLRKLAEQEVEQLPPEEWVEHSHDANPADPDEHTVSELDSKSTSNGENVNSPPDDELPL